MLCEGALKMTQRVCIEFNKDISQISTMPQWELLSWINHFIHQDKLELDAINRMKGKGK